MIDKFPGDLKYTKEHTWLKLESPNMGRVGITYHAQNLLKRVVFLELPQAGAKVEFMQPFGLIESAKATNDLFSPVTGIVREINQPLVDQPDQVNKDCYGTGWMMLIELAQPAEVGKLLDAEGYKKHLKP